MSKKKRLTDLVQKAVDDGANSVEEIHKSIADLPLDVLERLELFEAAVKDVRRVQDSSIGAVYDLIRRVNHQVTDLAAELLGPRPAAHRRESRRKAHPRPVRHAAPGAAHSAAG